MRAQDAAEVARWAQTFLSGLTSLDAELQPDSWVRVQAHTTTELHDGTWNTSTCRELRVYPAIGADEMPR